MSFPVSEQTNPVIQQRDNPALSRNELTQQSLSQRVQSCVTAPFRMIASAFLAVLRCIFPCFFSKKPVLDVDPMFTESEREESLSGTSSLLMKNNTQEMMRQKPLEKFSQSPSSNQTSTKTSLQQEGSGKDRTSSFQTFEDNGDVNLKQLGKNAEKKQSMEGPSQETAKGTKNSSQPSKNDQMFAPFVESGVRLSTLQKIQSQPFNYPVSSSSKSADQTSSPKKEKPSVAPSVRQEYGSVNPATTFAFLKYSQFEESEEERTGDSRNTTNNTEKTLVTTTPQRSFQLTPKQLRMLLNPLLFFSKGSANVFFPKTRFVAKASTLTSSAFAQLRSAFAQNAASKSLPMPRREDDSSIVIEEVTDEQELKEA